MNFAKNIPSKYFLLAIIILGFILRANNLEIGFPMLYVSNDEAIYHLSALNILANKTIFTIGNYGPLGSYLQIPFLLLAFATLFITGRIHSVHDLELLLVSQEGYMLFIPRIISSMFGTLSIFVTYKLSRELFEDKRIALWSSFFFAISFNLVHISHLARPGSPAIFFTLLAALFAVRSVKTRKNEFRNTILAFVAAATSFGFYQVNGLVFILISFIRAFGKRHRSIFSKSNAYAIVSGLILLIIFNYLSVGSDFFSILNPADRAIITRFPINPGNIFDVNYMIENSQVGEFSSNLLLTDGVLATLFLLCFLRKENRKRLYLSFLTFITFCYLLSSFVFLTHLRYFLTAFAFIPLFAGAAISNIANLKKKFLLILVIVVISSFNSIYWNFLLLREPTFDQVRRWLDANIASEVPIATTARRNFDYVPTEAASRPIRDIKPGFYGRAAMIVDNTFPYNVRNVLYLSEFDKGSKIENLKTGMGFYQINYIVDSYYALNDRLLEQSDDIKLELAAHFSPTGSVIYNGRMPQILFDSSYSFPLFLVDRAGPYFDVLAVK